MIEAPDIASLPSLPLSDRGVLPETSAIYFLLTDASEVVYVGKSACVKKRCNGYSRPSLIRRGVARIAWWACDTPVLGWSELAAIRKYRPRDNVTGHPSPEDLDGTVPVRAIVEMFGIPAQSIYAMVRAGRLPAVDATRAWHQTRRFRFRVSEVRAALEMDQPPTT